MNARIGSALKRSNSDTVEIKRRTSTIRTIIAVFVEQTDNQYIVSHFIPV